jgi:hypothetical protein
MNKIDMKEIRRMRSLPKKTYALVILLGLCLFPVTAAYAQIQFPPAGYNEEPTFYPRQIKLGQSITLYNEPDCDAGKGYPSVVFYASTSPTVGNSIANLHYGENSTTWTSTAAGTYYIAEYVTANGSDCHNLVPTPEFLELVVTAS